MNNDEYLYFVDRAFDGMVSALITLGDDRATLGRESHRDRESEFTATGTIAQPTRLVADRRLQLAQLHVLEEVAQHHGQIEISRDLLLAASEEDR